MSLCPAWSETFDGPVDPIWNDVWAESISQSAGQTVLTLTSATGDQYPRRVLAWQDLGVPVGASVRYRVTPAVLPSVVGTQLNTVFEGPAGYDVTLSLNNPGALEYRLTTRADGMETVFFEGPATFPLGGAVEFSIAAGTALVRILDAEGYAVRTFDELEIPFDIGDGHMGFAATNWAMLSEDVELAVEQFDLECE